MKKIIIFILICLFCFPGIVNAEVITLKKCVDGDTADFIINNEVTKVRFLAIDTPETKHPTKGVEPFGKEASEYTCKKLNNAKKIEIEYDDNSDKADKYNRDLGWIFTDGELLQGKLVENGLAKVAYLYGDYKYTDKLQSLENSAKKNKLGVWGDYKPNYENYIWIAIGIVLFTIMFIFNKRFRNKNIKKLENKIEKQIKRSL